MPSRKSFVCHTCESRGCCTTFYPVGARSLRYHIWGSTRLSIYLGTLHRPKPRRGILWFHASRIAMLLPSNFSAPTKASIFQSFLTGEIGSVILTPAWGNTQLEQTAHLDRAIPEHRPARLGLYQWAAPGEVRPVVHRPFPV